jgi:hypothetical protein
MTKAFIAANEQKQSAAPMSTTDTKAASVPTARNFWFELPYRIA